MPPSAVSLRHLIDSSRRLDELGIARVIANAAEAVHKQQKGGQPLDAVTPDAIVVQGDGEVTLKVGAGQPGYTAPERLRDEAGDRRSDVFSLGAILWEALAREPLFQGDIDGEIKAAVLEGAYRPASELNANVPAELDAICKKALARTPADRFPSCKVMAAELETVLDDAGYPEDNSAIADYLANQYVEPAPKPAREPSSRDTPLPGTPSIAEAKPSPTATLIGATPLAPVLPATTPPAPATTTAPSSTLPGMPSMLNTPPPAKHEAEKKSFSKTAVLGSLSSADLALPPVEEPAEPAAPSGKQTEVHGSASLADRLAAINEGTAQPGAVVMLGLPAVPPGADPSSIKTPPPGSITTAETVQTPALAASAPDTPTLVPQPPILPQPPVLPATVVETKTPPPSEAVQMPAAGTATAVSPADAPRESSPASSPASSPDLAATATPHPASVVSLPRPASESGAVRAGGGRDPLAGWGWGTGPQEAVDDDDFYDAQQSSKKRLVIAIGGAAAAVLLVVVAAFAFGGSKDDAQKQADVAVKQPEPAVDWSQPTEPPAPAQPEPNSALAVDPNAGSAVDPNAGSAIDPNAGSAMAAVTDPNAGSATATVIDPATGSAASNVAAVEPPKPAPFAATTAPEPPKPEPAPVAKVESPKPAPVAKVEPPKPAPVAKVEPPKPQPALVAKVEPKKPEPKAVAAVEPKKPEPKKKLEPPKPVAKTDPKNASWDPLKPTVKTADKQPKPVDPYANDTQKKPAVDANAAYKTGIQQFARGDSNGALTTFKASLAAHPDFAPTWRGIGMVYEKLGKKSQAKTAFRRYLQLSPSAGDADSIRERMERL